MIFRLNGISSLLMCFLIINLSTIKLARAQLQRTLPTQFTLNNPLKIALHSIFHHEDFGLKFSETDVMKSIRNECLALIKLPHPDPEGSELLKYTQLIGEINPHNSDPKSLIWPIKYDAQAINLGTPARSQTDKEFEDHTDCSFEVKPPRLFALSVLKADQLGGGKNEIIFSRDILKNVSKKSQGILRNTNFPTFIPPEFFKGVHQVSFPVLAGNDLLRYRYDCFNLNECSEEQKIALNEIQCALSIPEIRYDLYLPENVILFLDNARLLHSRKPILDRTRHLLRVRFHPKSQFLDNPPFTVEHSPEGK